MLSFNTQWATMPTPEDMETLEALDRAELEEMALVSEAEEKENGGGFMPKMRAEILLDKIAKMRDEWERFRDWNIGQPMPKWEDEFQEILDALCDLAEYEREEYKKSL